MSQTDESQAKDFVQEVIFFAFQNQVKRTSRVSFAKMSAAIEYYYPKVLKITEEKDFKFLKEFTGTQVFEKQITIDRRFELYRRFFDIVKRFEKLFGFSQFDNGKFGSLISEFWGLYVVS